MTSTFFSPNDPGSTRIAANVPANPGGSAGYADTASHLGDPATNDSYLVLAVDGGGQASALSNRVGAFDFGLAPDN